MLPADIEAGSTLDLSVLVRDAFNNSYGQPLEDAKVAAWVADVVVTLDFVGDGLFNGSVVLSTAQNYSLFVEAVDSRANISYSPGSVAVYPGTTELYLCF